MVSVSSGLSGLPSREFMGGVGMVRLWGGGQRNSRVVVVQKVVLANRQHVCVDALRKGGHRVKLSQHAKSHRVRRDRRQALRARATPLERPLTSPTRHPNCWSASRFHLVAACTTSTSIGTARPSPVLKVTGVRSPLRSSVSLTPLLAVTISGTYAGMDG